MKRQILAITFGLALMLSGVVFTTQNAEAKATISQAGGSLEWVQTNCQVVSTGEILGHSNNCNPGSSNCQDNDCSRF